MTMTKNIIIDDKHSMYTNKKRYNLKNFNIQDVQYKDLKIVKIILIF